MDGVALEALRPQTMLLVRANSLLFRVGVKMTGVFYFIFLLVVLRNDCILYLRKILLKCLNWHKVVRFVTCMDFVTLPVVSPVCIFLNIVNSDGEAFIEMYRTVRIKTFLCCMSCIMVSNL